MRVFILCVLLAGVTAPGAPVQSGQSNEQKARGLISQMITALGGQAYLTVQDSYSEGRYGRFHNEVMAASNVFFRYWKWPDQERYEITEQRDVVYIFQGDKQYEVIYRGATLLNPQKDDNVRQA